MRRGRLRPLVALVGLGAVVLAGLLLGRCYDGRVRRVGTALGNDHSWETGRQLASEWLAVGAAVSLQRSC